MDISDEKNKLHWFEHVIIHRGNERWTCLSVGILNKKIWDHHPQHHQPSQGTCMRCHEHLNPAINADQWQSPVIQRYKSDLNTDTTTYNHTTPKMPHTLGSCNQCSPMAVSSDSQISIWYHHPHHQLQSQGTCMRYHPHSDQSFNANQSQSPVVPPRL